MATPGCCNFFSPCSRSSCQVIGSSMRWVFSIHWSPKRQECKNILKARVHKWFPKQPTTNAITHYSKIITSIQHDLHLPTTRLQRSENPSPFTIPASECPMASAADTPGLAMVSIITQDWMSTWRQVHTNLVPVTRKECEKRFEIEWLDSSDF